jgi:hypothetical protein
VTAVEESYEITVVHRREGMGPLTQTITCDAEMAVSWLATVINEISRTLPSGEPPSWRGVLELGRARRDPHAEARAALSRAADAQCGCLGGTLDQWKE